LGEEFTRPTGGRKKQETSLSEAFVVGLMKRKKRKRSHRKKK